MKIPPSPVGISGESQQIGRATNGKTGNDEGQTWLASIAIVAINLLLMGFLTSNVYLTPGKMPIVGMWAASSFFDGWLTHRYWRARSRETRESLAEPDVNAGMD